MTKYMVPFDSSDIKAFLNLKYNTEKQVKIKHY